MGRQHFAEYTVAADGMILKDGHTMMNQDIAMELNRKSFLESEKVKSDKVIKDLNTDIRIMVEDSNGYGDY